MFTLTAFIKYVFDVGIAKAIVQPIMLGFTAYTLKDGLSSLYEKIDKPAFIEKIAGGKDTEVKYDIESAFAFTFNRLPAPDELAAVLDTHSLTAAAARIALQRLTGQPGRGV